MFRIACRDTTHVISLAADATRGEHRLVLSHRLRCRGVKARSLERLPVSDLRRVPPRRVCGTWAGARTEAASVVSSRAPLQGRVLEVNTDSLRSVLSSVLGMSVCLQVLCVDIIAHIAALMTFTLSATCGLATAFLIWKIGRHAIYRLRPACGIER